MTSITPEQCKKNADSCKKNNINPIMEEIKDLKKILNNFLQKDWANFRIENAKLPEVLEAKFDKRYAPRWVSALVYTLIIAMIIGVGTFVWETVTIPKQTITIEDVQRLIESNNNIYFEN